MSTSTSDWPSSSLATTKIVYQEHLIADVMRHYISGFVLPPNQSIIRSEWFIDVAAGKLIFKLFVQEMPEK